LSLGKEIYGEPADPMGGCWMLGDTEYGVKFRFKRPYLFGKPDQVKCDLYVFFTDQSSERLMVLLRDTKTGKFAVLQEPCQYEKTKSSKPIK